MAPRDDNPDELTQKTLKQVGERLRAIRKGKGFSNYEQFANKYALNRSTYGKYEKGQDLRLSSLLKILRIMEISPSDFFSEGFDS
ncbi:helix-turn-helix domain-containing protein [Mucilaginibacter sp.]|uniref:helix-turn-helix domain-containing protein n=1 Tax=Mucilaginibacter sp. TaxID=1882438 RepID=UPI003D0D4CC1